MKKSITVVLASVFLLAGTLAAQTMPAGADPAMWAKALKIHKKAIIIDGHNDVTSPMLNDDYDLGTSSLGRYHNDGDPYNTDLDRLKRSGITVDCSVGYVSSSYLKTGGVTRRPMDMLDATYREVEKYPVQLTMCTTAAEIRKAKKQNKICVLMGIEGGYAIENSLYALRNFY